MSHGINIFMFRGALASVSLSHPQHCDCQTCKAAQGDQDAFALLYADALECMGDGPHGKTE